MPLKLDVSVPAAHWVRLASEVGAVVRAVDPGATVIIYGHVIDARLTAPHQAVSSVNGGNGGRGLIALLAIGGVRAD